MSSPRLTLSASLVRFARKQKTSSLFSARFLFRSLSSSIKLYLADQALGRGQRSVAGGAAVDALGLEFVSEESTHFFPPLSFFFVSWLDGRLQTPLSREAVSAITRLLGAATDSA
jgi:hypothetical protein